MSCPWETPFVCSLPDGIRCKKTAKEPCEQATVLGVDYAPKLPTFPTYDDGMDFFTQFQVTEVLEHLSVSESRVAFGHYLTKANPVAFKIHAFNSKIMYDKELDYELDLYNTLATVGQGIPNLIHSVYTKTISRKQFDELPTAWHNFINDLLATTFGEWEAIKILVTRRRPDAVPLASWPGQDGEYDPHLARDAEMIKSIVFQVTFTLHALHLLGFQHNDLHLGNILIDPSPSQDRLEYFINNNVFHVPIKGCHVLIFDWDRGKHVSRVNPVYADGTECAAVGICDPPNVRTDFYFFIMAFMKKLENDLPADFQQFANDVVGQPLAAPFTLREGRICKQNETNNCQPLTANEPEIIWTPAQALYHPYFQSLKPRYIGQFCTGKPNCRSSSLRGKPKRRSVIRKNCTKRKTSRKQKKN